MIQRIQTVFLLLTSIVLGIEIFIPILSSSALQAQGIYQDGKLFIQENTISLVLLSLSALISFLAIFIYKNLNFQKNLILFGVVVLMGALVAAAMAFVRPTQDVLIQNASISPQIGTFLPFLAILFFALAFRNVGKDQKIIKSMDRLR